MEVKGALQGVRVLDLTRVLAGPFCTMMMADMGAEVLKIEDPAVGDDSRRFPPFVNNESVYFMNLNRNKRGITLNLKSPEGKKLLTELIKKSDIIVENFRPGTMKKLGFDWETIHKINPRIVYGAISGFGHTGPYSSRPGYDIIGQAMSGVMSVTGWPDGEPTRTGGPIGDIMGGSSATIALLAALHYRDLTGVGQMVDISLVDSLVAGLQIITQIYLAAGRIPQRIGNRYESTYPYDTFRTKDSSSIVIGCANDKFWIKLCELMGQEELAEVPEFKTNVLRVKNHEAIKPIVEKWTLQHTRDELFEIINEAGIPVAPILDIAQVVSDPHIAEARQMFVDFEYPNVGKLRVTNSHLKMSETLPGVRTPSPTIGQHNHEVLKELLGYSEEEIQAFEKDGTI